MRQHWPVLACLVLFSPGCISQRLARQTHTQAATVSEIHEQQVLNNIARFCVNSGETPNFSVVTGGSAGTTAAGNSAYGLSFNPTTLTGQVVNFGTSSVVDGQWSLDPVTNPDKLELMKCLFRHVTCGQADDECRQCHTKLRLFFGDDYSICHAPQGWFTVTDRKPKGGQCCCKYGEYCGTYICVDDQHFDYLSRVTLAVLDVATVSVGDLELALTPAVQSDNEPMILVTEQISLEERAITSEYQIPQSQYKAWLEQHDPNQISPLNTAEPIPPSPETTPLHGMAPESGFGRETMQNELGVRNRIQSSTEFNLLLRPRTSGRISD